MNFAIRLLTPLLAGSVLACVAAAATALQPFQQDALNKILATMDAQKAAMAKPQLEQTLAMLNESQVQQMMATLTAKQSAAPEPVKPAPEPATATPEDLAFNRAQYEPVIRKAWESAHAYDEFVEAKMAAYCPPQGTYAVFGSAWRYEVMPPSPVWPPASKSADLDVQVIGPSYAPQDGRYQFDFSKVRSTFDKTVVDKAIKAACDEYVKIGTAFMAEARAHMSKDFLPDGPSLEQAANDKLAPVADQLEETIKAQAPGGDYALFTALTNAQRVE